MNLDNNDISDECQYHVGWVPVVSRPENPELSPAHHLRDDLPPYWMTRGTADKKWGPFMEAFQDSAQSYSFPYHCWVVQGGGHGYKPLGNGVWEEMNQRGLSFLHSYGAMDHVYRVFRGMNINMDTLSHALSYMGH